MIEPNILIPLRASRYHSAHQFLVVEVVVDVEQVAPPADLAGYGECIHGLPQSGTRADMPNHGGSYRQHYGVHWSQPAAHSECYSACSGRVLNNRDVIYVYDTVQAVEPAPSLIEDLAN